jgi:serine/threonine protein kinase
MVHRDMKPSNVFVCRLDTRADFVKVLDFALVKALESPGHTRLTRYGETSERRRSWRRNRYGAKPISTAARIFTDWAARGFPHPWVCCCLPSCIWRAQACCSVSFLPSSRPSGATRVKRNRPSGKRFAVTHSWSSCRGWCWRRRQAHRCSISS